MITIGKNYYEIIHDYQEGFQEEAFHERYSEVLAKYDYIVGDWGYDQLRLKGFFSDTHPKANFETKYSAIQDYIYEYCNFGCSYFVLKKVEGQEENPKETDE